jgi:hypothetical protein
MTHEQLLSAMRMMYPTGCIYSDPSINTRYHVQYTTRSKTYTYCAASRIALARRLGLDVAQYEHRVISLYTDETVPDVIAGLPKSDWGY